MSSLRKQGIVVLAVLSAVTGGIEVQAQQFSTTLNRRLADLRAEVEKLVDENNAFTAMAAGVSEETDRLEAEVAGGKRVSDDLLKKIDVTIAAAQETFDRAARGLDVGLKLEQRITSLISSARQAGDQTTYDEATRLLARVLSVQISAKNVMVEMEGAATRLESLKDQVS